MKRLFSVTRGNDTMYFANKIEAKKFRDDVKGAKLSIGPDHRLFGVKNHPRSHSHNAKSGGPGNGFQNKKR